MDTAEGFLLGKLKDSGDIERGMADIAFRSDGKLYGWTNNNGGSDLYLIDINSCNGDDDTDCLVTKVGEFGQGTYGNGLSFDSNDNLYLFGDGDEDYFWKIDPDTGEYIEEIEFSSSGNGYTIGAASFDSNNTLYGARRNYGSMPADLITVDVNTGTITSKGQSTDMQYIDAIAFLPPEPTSTSTSTGSSTILLSVLQKMSDELKKNTTNTICPQGHNYSIVTGAPCTSFISTPISNQSNFFNRNLRLKDIGQDVLALQKYLNSKGFLVSQTGYGSLNNETTFFGPKTKTALIKFQKANNIFPPFGFFGPITRDFINK